MFRFFGFIPVLTLLVIFAVGCTKTDNPMPQRSTDAANADLDEMTKIDNNLRAQGFFISSSEASDKVFYQLSLAQLKNIRGQLLQFIRAGNEVLVVAASGNVQGQGQSVESLVPNTKFFVTQARERLKEVEGEIRYLGKSGRNRPSRNHALDLGDGNGFWTEYHARYKELDSYHRNYKLLLSGKSSAKSLTSSRREKFKTDTDRAIDSLEVVIEGQHRMGYQDSIDQTLNPELERLRQLRSAIDD